ncbi:MAG: hypothetical protein IIC51_00445 [Planctomycetes bacterium]|nr:hypothetical protein [Planctomycetota bacterium]
MEVFILSQQGFGWEDLMEYGFIIVIVLGGFLLRGAKAIIDAINKSRQDRQQSGPDAATPTQRVPPTAKGRSSLPTTPVARPLPPRIRRSGQAPVARPLPGRTAASGQVPVPSAPTPEKLGIPQLVRELATPQEAVARRSPDAPTPPRQPGSMRQPKPKPRPRKRSLIEASKPRRTPEERLGRLFPEEDLKQLDPYAKQLDPYAQLKPKKQTAARVDDGSGLVDMSSRAALRQAIVMNEILGRPLALRQQDDPDPWGS